MRSLMVAVLAAGLALTGCPNTEASFDDFGDRYDEINKNKTTVTTGGGDCTTYAEGEADGDYLFALSAKLSPKRAFALPATRTTTDDGAGGLSVGLTLQPLSKMDQTTPVCSAISFTDLAVGADGQFVWDLGEVTLCGDANPISVSEVVTTLTLTGELCGGEKAGFVCGAASGIVSKPLSMYDLAPESAFTMQKIDGAVPFPVIDCAKTPAEY